MAYDGAGQLFALGLRLTKLNADGTPKSGANNGYVTDALVSIDFGLTYSSPSAVTQNNGQGIACVSYQPPPSLLSGTIAKLLVCTPDPNILEFCCGGHVISTGGTNEIQSITTTGTPTGGTFTLSYAGQTTTPIAFNAASTVVASALTALSSIGTGNVTAAGGALPTAVTVTFTGALAATDVATLTATSSLTGGTTPTVAITTTTPGVVGSTSIGYQAPSVNVDPTPNGIAIEAWSRAVLNNAFAASLPYAQWVIPRAKLTPSSALSLAEANATTPELSGTCSENSGFGTGGTSDITFPTNRVWQFARVATIPNLTPGFFTIP